MKQELIMRWNAFSNQEKCFLKAMALLVVCIIFYAFVWQPVQHGRERFAQSIPEKEAKLLLMQAQAADIETLRNKYKSLGASADALKAAIAVSAKHYGLVPIYEDASENKTLVKNDKIQLALTLTQVSFNTWIKWVESLQSQNHVRIQFCRISPASLAGQVKIEAIFIAAE